MGVVVKDDGHYQGWLAGILCCFAAVGSDEHPVERYASRPSTRGDAAMVHEQPPAYQLPHQPYGLTESSQQLGSLQSDYTDRKIPSNLRRPSSMLEPLDFGPSSLFARRASQLLSHPSSPARAEAIDHQGLIPLRLAPVVLRETPGYQQYTRTPQHSSAVYCSPFMATQDESPGHRRSGSDDALIPVAPPGSYQLARETPFQRLVRRSTDALSLRHSQVYQDDASSRSYSDSQVNIISSRRSFVRIHDAHTADEVTSATSYTSNDVHRALQRPRRKQSAPSLSRLTGVTADADPEAVELNTITEEQRPEPPISHGTLDDPALNSHIPAVAPTMQMHVRSETLNDIGSAFSRPVTARSEHKDFDDLLREPDCDVEYTEDHARTRPASQVAKIRARSGSRVSGWLSSIRVPAMPGVEAAVHGIPPETAASISTTDKKTTPRRPRKHSTPSLSSLATTNADSQPVTTSSTPTSNTRGHSRSLTTESRMTSPPSTIIEGKPSIDTSDIWPVSAAGSAGLATSTEKGMGGGRSRDSTIAKTERLCEEEGWLPFDRTNDQVGLAF